MDNVSDIMTPGVVTVEATEHLDRARELMKHRSISHLPVVLNGALVGVLSRRDLWAACGEAEGDDEATRVTVQRVMSTPATTLDPASTVAWAATLIHMRHIGCIPIVHEGRLVGIITKTDLESVLDAEAWTLFEDALSGGSKPSARSLSRLLRKRSREWE